MKYPKTIGKIRELSAQRHGMMAWSGWEKEIEKAIDADLKLRKSVKESKLK